MTNVEDEYYAMNLPATQAVANLEWKTASSMGPLNSRPTGPGMLMSAGGTSFWRSKMLPDSRPRGTSTVVSPSSSAASLDGSLPSHPQRNGPLNMSELVKATKPVEDSISFPVIEWTSDDDCGDEGDNSSPVSDGGFPSLSGSGLCSDDDDDDCDPIIFRPGAVRRRVDGCHFPPRKRGLHRSKSRASRLSALGSSGRVSPSTSPSTAELGPAKKCLKHGSWGQFVSSDEDGLDDMGAAAAAAECNVRGAAVAGLNRTRQRRSRMALTSSPYRLGLKSSDSRQKPTASKPTTSHDNLRLESGDSCSSDVNVSLPRWHQQSNDGASAAATAAMVGMMKRHSTHTTTSTARTRSFFLNVPVTA